MDTHIYDHIYIIYCKFTKINLLKKNFFDQVLTTQNVNLKIKKGKLYKIDFFASCWFQKFFSILLLRWHAVATKLDSLFNLVAKYSGEDLVQMYSSTSYKVTSVCN